jgi:DNA-directed RNA polymerase subunit RPC12/RpoP
MMEKNRSTKAVVDAYGRRVTPVRGLPASQRVESPPCSACRSENTFIYATRQIARYCKCRYCGHTWTIGPRATPVDDIQTR